MDEPRPPTGVLVLRVWAEPGDGDEVRGRLRATLDIVSGTSREWAVAGRAALVEAVETWVDEFLEQAASERQREP